MTDSILSQKQIQKQDKKSSLIDFSRMEKRFWHNVIKGDNLNDCWKWKANYISNGYPQINLNNFNYLAHQFSFFLHNGYWSKLFVLHSCDNYSCTNPLHLREGSQIENMQDMKNHHRQHKSTGEQNNNSKLTDEKVLQIKKLLAKGFFQKEIALMFNVGLATISAIKTGRNWKHLN